MVLALKDTADFPISTKTLIDNDANFNYTTSGSINAYDRTYLDIINANRTFFFPPANVLIERSTDSGSTWTTVDTSTYTTQQRGNLMCGVGASLGIGTGNAATTQQLRVTLQYPGTSWYCSLDRAYIRWNTAGHSNNVTIQASTYGAQSTYTDIVSNQAVNGWSGDNMIKFSRRTAWGTNNSAHLYNIRFVFKYSSVNSSYVAQQSQVIKISLFGMDFWGTTGTPRYAGHLYNWDYLQNVTFPANVTATRFTAPMFKATGTTYPHLAGNGSILTLSGTGGWTAGTGALVLEGTAFRPSNSENGLINLGGLGQLWKNLYLSGNISNGTYTYTLPSATGTLALTSNIPTVNDATLTIQKNSTNVATFTANASSNVTADITVPESFSDLTGTVSGSQLDWSTLCAPATETVTTTMGETYTKFYQCTNSIRSVFGGHGVIFSGFIDFGGSSGSATVNKTAVPGLTGYYGYKTNSIVPIAPNSTMLYSSTGFSIKYTPGSDPGSRWLTGNLHAGLAIATDGYIYIGVTTANSDGIGSWERHQFRYPSGFYMIDHQKRKIPPISKPCGGIFVSICVT